MAKKSPRQRLTHRALSVVAVMLIIGFGASIVSLARIQLFQSEKYRAQAEGNQLQDTELSAARGTIYDANGKVLAESADVWLVYIMPHKVPNDAIRQTLCERLAEILDMSVEAVREKADLTHMKNLRVKRRIELSEKEQITELMQEKIVYLNDKNQDVSIYYYSMVGLDPDVKRYYPLGSFASAVIGFTGADDIGRAGLEMKYDSMLTGVPGRRITAQNGRSDDMAMQYETVYDAKQGTSLVLTIDEVIQRYLEKNLEQAYVETKANATYGIVMDVKTGAVLAMAGMPNYDLNSPHTITNADTLGEIAKITDKTEKNEAIKNAQFSMWRNRVVSDTYEPGSIFKVFVAAAALEEKTYALSNTHYCTGSLKVASETYRCHKREGHGLLNFTGGLMKSCNPMFITIGQSLGTKKFYNYFEAFGFTEKTGIDLLGESAPVKGVNYHSLEAMGPVELASSSFGQSFSVTPIQMITALCAIANGGYLMQPYVVSEMLDENGNTVSKTEPTIRRQVISEETAKAVTEMMRLVVLEGTGKNGYVAGYNVAGKTGTSQKLGKDGYYVASFTCFAPADDPQYAILITIDEPVGEINGGAVAAPVAARVMEEVLTYRNVEPSYTDEEIEMLYQRVSDVTGEAVGKAKATLASDGFEVRTVGDGGKVVSQVPAAGQNVTKGGVVVLYTTQESKVRTTAVPNLSGLTVSQAINRATYYGLNIKISGNALSSNDRVVYQQSVQAGEIVELGRMITVYFKSSSGLEDYG